MSSRNDMPPPPQPPKVKLPNQKCHRAGAPPDPNADRPPGYGNEWRIEHNKQTAKCRTCSHSLAGTRWCVTCCECNKRICPDCWNGDRYNDYGEHMFEGEAQNLEGCWHSNSYPGRWMAAVEARSNRMRAMIAEENRQKREATLSPSDQEGPVPKKAKLDSREDERAFATATSSLTSLDDDAWHDLDRTKQNDAVWEDPFVDDFDLVTDHPHNHDAASRKDSLQSRIDHLHNKTTVIIGAGVIGLAIARELAAAVSHTNTAHEIVVVETRDNEAELASHDCAGLITKHGLPEGLGSLLDLSLAAWRDLVENEGMRQEFRFQPDSVVHAKIKTPDRREHNAEPPSWYAVRPKDIFRSHAGDVGKISSPHHNRWLYEECMELGVKFRFHQEVMTFDKTKNAQLLGAQIGSSLDGDNRSADIQCNNLIVAAGPWTTEVLRQLLPWTDQPENNSQYYDWIRIPRINIRSYDNTGLLLRNTADGEGAIAAAQSRSREILVAAISRKRKAAGVIRTSARSQNIIDENESSRAKMLATAVVERFHDDNFTEGRALISTANNNLPIIGKIPSKVVDARFEGVDNNPLGIYVAYGFGKHGTTLAPGTATLMRRMVCRDEPVGEWSKVFAYPGPVKGS